jgi:hypothetical protein
VTGLSAKNKHKIVYPNLNSAIRPTPHDENLPVPEPLEQGLTFLKQMECEDGSSPQAIQHSSDNHTSQRRGLQNQNNLISRN